MNVSNMELRQVIAIPALSVYRDDPDFKETGNTIRKQLVKLLADFTFVEFMKFSILA